VDKIIEFYRNLKILKSTDNKIIEKGLFENIFNYKED